MDQKNIVNRFEEGAQNAFELFDAFRVIGRVRQSREIVDAHRQWELVRASAWHERPINIAFDDVAHLVVLRDGGERLLVVFFPSTGRNPRRSA